MSSEGRFVVTVTKRRIGWSGTYRFVDYGGFPLAPDRGWWRPTRRWIDKTMRRVIRD